MHILCEINLPLFLRFVDWNLEVFRLCSIIFSPRIQFTCKCLKHFFLKIVHNTSWCMDRVVKFADCWSHIQQILKYVRYAWGKRQKHYISLDFTFWSVSLNFKDNLQLLYSNTNGITLLGHCITPYTLDFQWDRLAQSSVFDVIFWKPLLVVSYCLSYQ